MLPPAAAEYFIEVTIYQGYPRLRRERFFLSACILSARPREQNARRQNISSRGNDLLNRYLLREASFLRLCKSLLPPQAAKDFYTTSKMMPLSI